MPGLIGQSESLSWAEDSLPTGTVAIHRVEGDYAWGTLEIRAPGHHSQYNRDAWRVCDPTCEVQEEVTDETQQTMVTVTASFQAGLNP